MDTGRPNAGRLQRIIWLIFAGLVGAVAGGVGLVAYTRFGQGTQHVDPYLGGMVVTFMTVVAGFVNQWLKDTRDRNWAKENARQAAIDLAVKMEQEAALARQEALKAEGRVKTSSHQDAEYVIKEVRKAPDDSLTFQVAELRAQMRELLEAQARRRETVEAEQRAAENKPKGA